ncbi:MAG: ankyrin repeat domain-containing protein, partial [Betaproteobacteria bacterium]
HCDQYGVDHRTPMNLTPLMAAAFAGNVPLVEALLARGADPQAADDFGCNALHWAMREAFRDPAFAGDSFAALYELIAPAAVDVQAAERLVRIDRHLSEYFLFQTLWALYGSRFTHRGRRPVCGFETGLILAAWEHLPANVVPAWRKRREHLSGVLARNEVERDYAYNRALFRRVAQGWYQFNPRLAVRRKAGESEEWTPIPRALNLPLINEVALDTHRSRIADYLAQAGLPAPACPIAVEHHQTRRRAAEETCAEQDAEARAAVERRRQAKAMRGEFPPAAPRWGTPDAKQREIERLREEIARRRASEDGSQEA